MAEPHYFVGIGAQRTGSTWLANYCMQHPQIFMSPVKELHFFDTHTLGDHRLRHRQRLTNGFKKLQKSLMPDSLPNIIELQEHLARLELLHDPAIYKDYFARRVTNERAFGEITPSYSLLEETGFASILAHYPQARFIFVMRNPTDRYCSQLSFANSLGRIANMQEAVHLRLEDPGFTGRSNFKRTITCLENVVPPARIFYMFHEHLFGPNGSLLLNKLTDFLGVDFMPADFSVRINTRNTFHINNTQRKNIIRTFEDTYEFVLNRFESAPASWHEDMNMLASSGA